MSGRFHPLTLDEFSELLSRFRFTRRIDAVHMHHTWRPNHAQYRGEASIEAMWRYHTRENGWKDIAQHVSIAPDGTIWTGRDWNAPPVSATGYNGTRISGPFMFEVIGDFDRGCDLLEGKQKEAVVGVIARVQEKFGLPPESLRFHNFMTDKKSCPGSGVDYQAMVAELQETRATLAARSGAREGGWAVPGSAEENQKLEGIVRQWSAELPRGVDPGDAEPQESEMSPEQVRRMIGLEGTTVPGPEGRGMRGGGSGPELTPEMREELRPHVINLNRGEFSEEGDFQSSRADVDALFEDHLKRAHALARANDRPLRILFYAHGGLVSEGDGLWIAHQQAQWWKRNDIYPIHFVWETGFCDALKQILSGARELAATRGFPRDIWDYTTDPAVEALARSMGGVKIWGAMKESARLAAENSPENGSWYVARKLSEFCKAHPEVELHAVGHSAGSIFHSWFLPRAFAEGVPPFASLHFLAPAIRVDAFKTRLLGHLGGNIRHLTMFTMKRDWEEADNVAQIYRKSLLYLIHYALEPKRREPVLGLEISARNDAAVADLFGLRGRPSSRGDVVWSVSQATSGRSASTSRTHGGFDNDRATMNSVARRVLDRDDIVEFPAEAAERGIGDIWNRPPQIPAEFQHLFLLPQRPPVTAAVPPAPFPPQVQAPLLPMPTGGGRRRALCIGIDTYPTAPLMGCVADAREWGGTLEGMGFGVSYLLNEKATRSAILDELRKLVDAGTPGDVTVFQFAGHGTELEDIDGDEVDGTNGPRDEALCPYDLDQGAFVIDDDISQIFAGIREGVNFTCFIDCCHSGTITRFMVGGNPGGAGDLRPRFLPATAAMQEGHKTFRERIGRTRAEAGRRPEKMRQVVFAACLDREVAYETGGHGEFTVRANKILRQGIAGLTNEEFQKRVTEAFGPFPRQNPGLDCAPPARQAPLLQPATVAGRSPSPARGGATVAEALRTLADALTLQGG